MAFDCLLAGFTHPLLFSFASQRFQLDCIRFKKTQTVISLRSSSKKCAQS